MLDVVFQSRTRMALTLIFSHGMESGPGATKISALADIATARGHVAYRPDYRDLPDWRARLDRLEALVAAEEGPVVLVGSSIGAYISALASVRFELAGLFLLAPPIEAAPVLPRLSARAEPFWIYHGWSDELISPHQVVGFAQEHNARLTLLDSDHRLGNALPTLCRGFSEFLDGLQDA